MFSFLQIFLKLKLTSACSTVYNLHPFSMQGLNRYPGCQSSPDQISVLLICLELGTWLHCLPSEQLSEMAHEHPENRSPDLSPKIFANA